MYREQCPAYRSPAYREQCQIDLYYIEQDKLWNQSKIYTTMWKIFKTRSNVSTICEIYVFFYGKYRAMTHCIIMEIPYASDIPSVINILRATKIPQMKYI